jgi:NAD(P)-dependent dehydrogenase (short-subunit alcohol dehydrogenase family)
MVSHLDVTDESAAQAAVQTAVAAFRRPDVVVNNAGYGDIAPFEQLSAERFKAVMDTNFYGVVNVTRAAVLLMRERRSGCILQISSVGGRLTRPDIRMAIVANGKRIVRGVVFAVLYMVDLYIRAAEFVANTTVPSIAYQNALGYLLGEVSACHRD